MDSQKYALQLKASSSVSSSSNRMGDFVVAGKYRIVRKIGSGSFGDIYLGVNITSGEEVAVKMESTVARHPQLLYEFKLYRILAGAAGKFPSLIFFIIKI